MSGLQPPSQVRNSIWIYELPIFLESKDTQHPLTISLSYALSLGVICNRKKKAAYLTVNEYAKDGAGLSCHEEYLCHGCVILTLLLANTSATILWHFATSQHCLYIHPPQEKVLKMTPRLCQDNWHIQAHVHRSLAQTDLGPPGFPVRSLADESCQIKLFPSIVTRVLYFISSLDCPLNAQHRNICYAHQAGR